MVRQPAALRQHFCGWCEHPGFKTFRKRRSDAASPGQRPGHLAERTARLLDHPLRCDNISVGANARRSFWQHPTRCAGRLLMKKYCTKFCSPRFGVARRSSYARKPNHCLDRTRSGRRRPLFTPSVNVEVSDRRFAVRFRSPPRRCSVKSEGSERGEAGGDLIVGSRFACSFSWCSISSINR